MPSMAPQSTFIPEHVIRASLGAKYNCHANDVAIRDVFLKIFARTSIFQDFKAFKR